MPREAVHVVIAHGLAFVDHPDAADRFEGYQQAMSDAGLEVVPQLVRDGDFSAEAGHRCVQDLVASGEHFTAIFAANDTTAYGARLALHQAGRDVPQDVSLVGFDDQMEASFVTPPLSTMRQCGKAMGETASATILKMIHGEPSESMMFRAELVELGGFSPKVDRSNVCLIGIRIRLRVRQVARCAV